VFGQDRPVVLRCGAAGTCGVMKGRCSESELTLGCVSVPAHAGVAYSFWQWQSNLCVKRLKNYNFYSF
jgi:hypothetical protein